MSRPLFLLIAVLSLAALVIVSLMFFNSNEEEQEEYLPEWYNVQNHPDYLFVFGHAERITPTAAENSAYTNAMAEASRYVNSRVEEIVSEISENNKNQASAEPLARLISVTSGATLTGTFISKRETVQTIKGRQKSFVRVSIPKSSIAEAIYRNIKEDEVLYEMLMSSPSFRDLASESTVEP